MRRFLALSLVAALACDTSDSPQPPPPTRVAPAPLQKKTQAGPRIAILSTTPGASHSSLRLQPVHASAAVPPIASLEHLPDGEVRGQLVPQTGRVFAVAETEPGKERSFRSSLWALASGELPRKLSTGLVYASQPLALADGRVVVQRGSPGAALSPEDVAAGKLRSDNLSVDVFDDVGHVKTLHSITGYTTHIAGSYKNEVVLYRVWFQHADLVAVDLDAGGVRTLAPSIPAFARDFSIDPTQGHLYFSNRDAAGWQVERITLKSGERISLARAEDMRVTPSFWPGGGVMVNDALGGRVLGGNGPVRPLGAGFDEVRAVGDPWVALEHHVPSKFSVPYVYDTKSRRLHVLSLPEGQRHSIAGVSP